jgi:deazaflavin-dependent oxidoreductase (nitroreductase family)
MSSASRATWAEADSRVILDEAAAARSVCQLITTGRRSGQPRSIEIWFAAAGDRVYMLSGGGEGAHWVQNLRREPRVRLEIDGRTYEGRARVIQGEAADPVARATVAAKYGTGGLEDWLRESLAVEIELLDEPDEPVATA